MGGTRFACEQAREQVYYSCAFLCRYNKHASTHEFQEVTQKSLWNAHKIGACKCQVKIKLSEIVIDKQYGDPHN